MSIRINLIGPFEIVIDGEVAPKPRPKQRTVVGLLATKANHTVTIDALIAELWGDNPPSAALANVRTYVNTLRNLLGPGHRDRLVTTLSGYRLETHGNETDLAEVESLTDQGRRASGQGGTAEAALAFDAAVALLDRGAPLEDIPVGTALESLREAFMQQFVLVREDRFAAKIAAGSASSVVADLAAHVRRHPLREQAHAHLMRARHASGSVADALAGYREARQALRDELGLEPGTELRALHDAILRGDAPEAAPPLATSTVAIPQMLPRRVRDFVARDVELGRIEAALRPRTDGPRIVALHGVGGAGKSALMNAAAHRCRDRFPDGQLYVDMRGATPDEDPISTADAVGRMLRACGWEQSRIPDDEYDAIEAYHLMIASRRVLVLLDNVASAASVAPLLPRDSAAAALITSRELLAFLDGAEHVAVGAFSATEAAAFLRRIGGAEDASDVIAEVAQLCGHLALPLRVIAARRASRPDWSYVELADRLRNEQHRLDEMYHGDTEVRSILQASYDMLARSSRPRERASAKMLRAMGMLPLASFAPAALARAAGMSPIEARRALDGLVTARLAEADGDRYSMHDLIRLVAVGLAGREPVSVRDRMIKSFVDWYVIHVEAADAILRPTVSPFATLADAGAYQIVQTVADARAFFDSERAHIVRLLELTAAPGGTVTGVTAATARLVMDTCGWYWARQGYWTDEFRLAEMTMIIAEREQNRSVEAFAMLALARVEGRRRRFDDATQHLLAAQAVFKRIGDPDGQLVTIGELGLIERFRGDLPAALVHLNAALAVARDHGRRRSQGVILLNLGMVHGDLGDFAASRECLDETLAIRLEIGDRTGEVVVRVAQGPLLANLGDWGAARRTLDLGAALAGELGLLVDAAYARTYRSVVHLRAGCAAEAAVDAEAAVSFLSTVDDPSMLARAHRQAARAHGALGRCQVAVDHHAAANEIWAANPPQSMVDMDLFFGPP